MWGKNYGDLNFGIPKLWCVFFRKTTAFRAF